MTKSVYVMLPAFGQTCLTHTVSSLVALSLDLPRHGVGMGFATYSYTFLERIRGLMLTYWFDKTDASHMLFVDADMSFEPIVVRRMLDYDVPLVGVVYPTRSSTPSTRKQNFVGSFFTDTKQNEQGFMPVRGLGGGLMLIRRDCIERLLVDQPEVSDERPATEVLHGDLMREMGLSRMIGAFNFLTVEEKGIKREFGEDLSFCERVRRAGMEVWGSVGDPVGHVGFHEWFGCMGTPLPRPGQEIVQAA